MARRPGAPAIDGDSCETYLRLHAYPTLGRLAEHLARHKPGPAGLVFTNTAGNPITRSLCGGMWHRAAPKAAIPEWATFHDLRHFYASLLIAKGCSVKAIQKRLGQQPAMETLDTYGHLWPDSDDETRDAVDLVLGSISVATG